MLGISQWTRRGDCVRVATGEWLERKGIKSNRSEGNRLSGRSESVIVLREGAF